MVDLCGCVLVVVGVLIGVCVCVDWWLCCVFVYSGIAARVV